MQLLGLPAHSGRASRHTPIRQQQGQLGLGHQRIAASGERRHPALQHPTAEPDRQEREKASCLHRRNQTMEGGGQAGLDHPRALIKHSSSTHPYDNRARSWILRCTIPTAPRGASTAQLHPDRLLWALSSPTAAWCRSTSRPDPTPGRPSWTRHNCRSGSVRAPTGWRTCCSIWYSPGLPAGGVDKPPVRVGPHPAARMRARRDPRARGRRIPAAVLPAADGVAQRPSAGYGLARSSGSPRVPVWRRCGSVSSMAGRTACARAGPVRAPATSALALFPWTSSSAAPNSP